MALPPGAPSNLDPSQFEQINGKYVRYETTPTGKRLIKEEVVREGGQYVYKQYKIVPFKEKYFEQTPSGQTKGRHRQAYKTAIISSTRYYASGARVVSATQYENTYGTKPQRIIKSIYNPKGKKVRELDPEWYRIKETPKPQKGIVLKSASGDELITVTPKGKPGSPTNLDAYASLQYVDITKKRPPTAGEIVRAYRQGSVQELPKGWYPEKTDTELSKEFITIAPTAAQQPKLIRTTTGTVYAIQTNGRKESSPGVSGRSSAIYPSIPSPQQTGRSSPLYATGVKIDLKPPNWYQKAERNVANFGLPRLKYEGDFIVSVQRKPLKKYFQEYERNMLNLREERVGDKTLTGRVRQETSLIQATELKRLGDSPLRTAVVAGTAIGWKGFTRFAEPLGKLARTQIKISELGIGAAWAGSLALQTAMAPPGKRKETFYYHALEGAEFGAAYKMVGIPKGVSKFTETRVANRQFRLRPDQIGDPWKPQEVQFPKEAYVDVPRSTEPGVVRFGKSQYIRLPSANTYTAQLELGSPGSLRRLDFYAFTESGGRIRTTRPPTLREPPFRLTPEQRFNLETIKKPAQSGEQLTITRQYPTPEVTLSTEKGLTSKRIFPSIRRLTPEQYALKQEMKGSLYITRGAKLQEGILGTYTPAIGKQGLPSIDISFKYFKFGRVKPKLYQSTIKHELIHGKGGLFYHSEALTLFSEKKVPFSLLFPRSLELGLRKLGKPKADKLSIGLRPGEVTRISATKVDLGMKQGKGRQTTLDLFKAKRYRRLELESLTVETGRDRGEFGGGIKEGRRVITDFGEIKLPRFGGRLISDPRSTSRIRDDVRFDIPTAIKQDDKVGSIFRVEQAGMRRQILITKSLPSIREITGVKPDVIELPKQTPREDVRLIGTPQFDFGRPPDVIRDDSRTRDPDPIVKDPPPLPPDLWLPRRSAKRQSLGLPSLKIPGIKTGYTPSVEAIYRGVTAPKLPSNRAYKTGLVLRPIVI